MKIKLDNKCRTALKWYTDISNYTYSFILLIFIQHLLCSKPWRCNCEVDTVSAHQHRIWSLVKRQLHPEVLSANAEDVHDAMRTYRKDPGPDLQGLGGLLGNLRGES